MATMRAALRNFLNADATLTTLLPGGFLDANSLPSEWSISDVPHDGAMITPFAVLRWRGATPKEVYITDMTERRSVEIYIYQHRGYDLIEQAKRRIKTILHRTQIAADDADVCMFHWNNDLGEFTAKEIGGAAAEMSRFYVDYIIVTA
jgi:hypothetical protein